LNKEHNMGTSGYPHQYHIGDSVLATVGREGARIPGVIAAEEDGRFQVSLAQPWVDDQSQEVQDVWLSPDQLEPELGEDSPGALPG
jgi:hypothetical protein